MIELIVMKCWLRGGAFSCRAVVMRCTLWADEVICGVRHINYLDAEDWLLP